MGTSTEHHAAWDRLRAGVGAIWNLGKIEGFKKLFGEVGTQVFLGVWGVAGIVLGVWLLVQ